ncbi:MAG: OmpA family protein [Deltaproteobacteria bacterium]|nr:OmpA family protein [Deltaproteobacteria bacterium]MBW2396485.1 OmpA family protein [Deltaproteobacteria bacterium]
MRSLMALFLTALLLTVGCASTPPPATCAAIGAGLGGGGGAAYGASNDRHHDGDSIAGYGALGILVGGAAGYGICYALQDRKAEEKPAEAPVEQRATEPAPAPPPVVAADPCHETVTFEGVHFEFDRAEILPSGRGILDGVASRLDECRDTRVRVAGHTDSIGTEAYNQGLSERRAAAVASYLVSHGVAATRLDEVGHGEGQPVADNATDAGRARNRRVELEALR